MGWKQTKLMGCLFFACVTIVASGVCVCGDCEFAQHSLFSTFNFIPAFETILCKA